MGKRGNREGSIYKRKDGRWAIAFDLGTVNGRRKRCVFYAPTQKAAIAIRDQKKEDLRKGHRIDVDRRETVKDYLRWWIDDVERGRVANGELRDTTVDGYDDLIQRYVVGALGSKKISDLRMSDVHTFLRSLETAVAGPPRRKGGHGRKALSPASRRQIRAILSVALKDAVRFGKLAHNPVTDTDAPSKQTHKLHDALSVEEANQLLTAVKGDQSEALVTVALMIGLRRGEALALQWSQIDLTAGTVKIEGTLKRRVGVRAGVAGAGLIVNAPKTESGRRVVPLPPVVVRALTEHKARQAKERLTPWVFAGPTGGPLDPSAVTRQYHRLTIAAGLGPRRFHALRHSAAVLQLAAGVPLSEVSQNLGHAGVSITSDVYGQLPTEARRQGADAMERLFGDA